jgi:uncharacterized RDD family membrane protein YckC
MSDISHGPGWWIAADGKWYPPEQHPDYRPPPPPSFAPAPPPPPQAFSAPYPTSAPPLQYAAARTWVGPPLADYGARLGGWLIDWLLVGIVLLPISLLTHSFQYQHLTTNFNGVTDRTTTFNWGGWGAVVSPLIILAYGMFFCGSARGQTIGMMVTRVKVVKTSTGAPIGYGAALGRAAFEELLAVALFIPWVIDMLFPLWDPRNQTLHDKVSGSVVIRADSPR